MAMAMAMAMLKMDKNVYLQLERHVNRALFYYLWLSSWHKFVYFSKYWVASDRKRKGRKGSLFQACHRYLIYKTIHLYYRELGATPEYIGYSV